MKQAALRAGDLLDDIFQFFAVLLRSQWWVWLMPLGVLYATTRWPMARNEHIIGAVVAVGVFAWAVRRPAKALVALMVFLPLQTVGFGFLLALHVPGQVLRLGGGLKELLGVSILVSALHALHVGRTREAKVRQLDAIDKAALAYVAVATIYLLVPHLFTSFYVSPHFSVRLLAWRADCGYVLLFFAVRHAPLAPETRQRFVRVLMAIVGLVVITGLYQLVRPASWSHLILVTGRQVSYQTSVLGNNQTTVVRDLGYLTNIHPLRISSLFLSPFDLADFMLIPLAIAVERIARNYRSKWSYVLCGVVLLILFATQVRADALGAIAIGLIALIPTPHRPAVARLRLLGAMLIGALVLLPALSGSRFFNGQGGAKSNHGHVSELTGGVQTLARNPLGLGIGDAAGVGDRFVLQQPGQQGGFTVDNAVLQVGDELGVQALLPWLLLMILVWRALGRASKQPDPFAAGIRLAFLAILIAGMYHEPFLTFPVPWILWAAIGLVLRPAGVGATPGATGNIERLDAISASDVS
ncbi:MAG: hypothetical protein ACRDZ8_12415 [Acidimicrobiales bacterium]